MRGAIGAKMMLRRRTSVRQRADKSPLASLAVARERGSRPEVGRQGLSITVKPQLAGKGDPWVTS